jgi:hypothetical protein
MTEGIWECWGCGERYASKAAGDNAVCCEAPAVRQLWPISGAEPKAKGFVAHENAVRDAGWVSLRDKREAFKEGDRVLYSIDNGWETWATILKFYKNGGAQLAIDGKFQRVSCVVWKKASDI